MTDALAGKSTQKYSVFYPLLVAMVAFVVLMGFQLVHIMDVRAQLNRQETGQSAILQNAQKMRTQLDAISLETAIMARNGNPNAKLIVGELQKRGITINVP